MTEISSSLMQSDPFKLAGTHWLENQIKVDCYKRQHRTPHVFKVTVVEAVEQVVQWK